MKKILVKISVILLFMTITFACTNSENEAGKTNNSLIQSEAIILSELDTSVSPGNDFYQYANGGWMKQNPIPDEFSRYGSFDVLAERNNELVKNIMTSAAESVAEPGSITQKIGDFYNTGMDTEKIEKQGISPLQDILEKIESIQNMDEIKKHIATMHGMDIMPLFNIYPDADMKNSKLMIAYLTQGGLGMSDRDYYVKDDERTKKIRRAYQKHIEKMFVLAGENQKIAKETAKNILGLETRLAENSMTRLERRNPENIYHKTSFEELKALCPEMDWEMYFSTIGITPPEYLNVSQPDFYKTMNTILKEIPVAQWKKYLKWNLINNTAIYLSSDFVNEHFSFYGKVMQGKKELRPRWKRVVGATNNALGEAVGQKFVEKHFPPEAKLRMLNLVNNLKASLGERISALEWMSDTTKTKALEKLETISVKIGYPDQWRDYSALEIKTDSYVENVLRGNKFNFDYYINKIGKPVDPNDWHMYPQTVNAYYNPSMNEIVFPAAILQPPFFYLNADDAVNYGAIGVVIGHEMTHGFDDQGRRYDKDGNLTDWWTKADAKRFEKRTKVLVNQFNNFVVLDTVHADGELTLGENIADLGGLNISFQAFKKAQVENPQTGKVDGFTPEQRFFLAYAKVWAQNIRDEEILRRTKEDVHSLGKFRVNGPLPNVATFYEAFDIKPGDKMYIPEQKRATIW